MTVLICKINGVNERVFTGSDDNLKAKIESWLPELRAGRVQFQDFGYKVAVVSEDGLRVFELFKETQVKS